MTWTFRNQNNEDITATIDPVEYRRILGLGATAAKATATPMQSGYFVRGAAFTQKGRVFTGGNHEKAANDTLVHGEEALIVQAADTDASDSITHMVFVSQSLDVIRPCGNCRDAIRERCPSTIIATVHPPSKTAWYAQASEFSFDSFAPMIIPARDDAIEIARRATLGAANALVPNAVPTYGATLVTSNQQLIAGSYFGTTNYTPTYAIQAAVSQFHSRLAEQNDATVPGISRLVVAGFDTMPIPWYKDRQFATELSERLGNTQPIPVELYALSRLDGGILGAWRTDVEEWMPHAFTARALGMPLTNTYARSSASTQ